MIYENPNTKGSLVNFAERYDNFIGGEYVPPAKGKYFENISPVTGKVFCEVARSTQEDVDRSEEHTSELQSRFDLVCRLLLEKKNIYLYKINNRLTTIHI